MVTHKEELERVQKQAQQEGQKVTQLLIRQDPRPQPKACNPLTLPSDRPTVIRTNGGE